jgi:NAD(P)-dependent dehydrogenase (short-subunit alcohol dehydrogenase family)
LKHAVVVGGTGGIGAGVVRCLLAEQWQVTATGVSDREIETFGRDVSRAEVEKLDVTDSAAVANLFSLFGRVDALVNCAGILSRDAEYNIEVFCKVIDVNLTGTMRTCLAAYPLLCRSRGVIVNTASMLSTFGGPRIPAYSASKGGVAQLTKALAGQWAADGIRVNAVAPGWINTEMTQALRSDKSREQAILTRTPQNRWGEPAEVGTLIAWLVSDAASFVTGSIYNVDGGYAAM